MFQCGLAGLLLPFEAPEYAVVHRILILHPPVKAVLGANVKIHLMTFWKKYLPFTIPPYPDTPNPTINAGRKLLAHSIILPV
jgi:predicted alpha/beta hydrolase